MGLFEIFRNKKRLQPEKVPQTLDDPTIFYHEDDFRQVEIVPDDNLLILKSESEKVDKFAKEHTNVTGFTDIYVRSDENKIKLNQREIIPNDLENILSSLGLKRNPNVLSGYGQNYREKHENCIAFGKDYCAIYYDFKDNVVQNIWLTNHWSMDREKLTPMLNNLGIKWNLLLQDWNLNVTIDLKDKNSIEQYLQTYIDK